MNTHSYKYPRPALTVDIVLFSFKNESLQTLLIQRKNEPFAGMWAYPGGFVDDHETAELAAVRELWEETGVYNAPLQQLFTDTELNRDPRGWIISVVFFALVSADTIIKAGDDARNVEWHSVHHAPEMVFGHELFLKKGMEKCRNMLLFSAFGKELLPDEFTLKTLYKLYLELIDIPEQLEQIVKRLADYGVLIQIGDKWHFEKGRYMAIKVGGFLK
jgi:8-oxo-dGTP diphosphatase